MEPNDNPPCEREWSIAEREEFFASQDARTYPGLSGNPINMEPFRPSPSISNCGDPRKWYPAGIYVTSIVPPAQGWPVAMYCPLCKETTFLLSPWAAKPVRGDYFKLSDTCASDEHSGSHNMKMAMISFDRRIGQL